MTNNYIIEKINEFLVDEFEVDGSKIKPDAILRDTLELDSLDYVDLVVVIERNFGFKVVAQDLQNIHTFQNFYDYVIVKVAEKQSA